MHIIKQYQFNLKDGATEKALVDVGDKFNLELVKLDGFLYRSLSQTENGEWLDTVYWSGAEAEEKGGKVMEKPVAVEYMALIDEASVKVTRSVVHSSIYPEMDMA
ncbi:hypothetical protein [Teredinibacter sp. KSP-S5-2]|uniref:hypothetical protein n=1 Tax=Teredinibacter sp. KSP-S5-2 TaxID=3034506 RepID=UPI0029352BD8|nr:hypothetical protein [Teredinibacter sp. KSP-S5-2]WNO09515.1 hypothetical protein P5V12_21490 [Teredinibacter sp. KSP-S5-2]